MKMHVLSVTTHFLLYTRCISTELEYLYIRQIMHIFVKPMLLGQSIKFSSR